MKMKKTVLGVPLKILSLNCNGIRSATSKGLHDFIKNENFDILCFQEIKAIPEEIDIPFYHSLGFKEIIFPAEKKGYSGTAIFTKQNFKKFMKGVSHPLFDQEGRVITVDFDSFILINAYFPSGTSGESRQAQKMIFLETISSYVDSLKKINPKLILTGDINIAHTEMDIHDSKGNKKNSGFLPEERQWVDNLLHKGWVDGFRVIHPQKRDTYSWWTYRFSARSKNKGWRIDSFFIANILISHIKDCGIYSDIILSDHAPIYLNLTGIE